MGCCGSGGIRPPKDEARLGACSDGRQPRATPDAIYHAKRMGFDLCSRQDQGTGRDGMIVANDVLGWA